MNDYVVSTDQPSHHQVPSNPFDEFMVQAQGACDFMFDVIPVQINDHQAMVICTKEAAIYITREQAKAFFGLVEGNITLTVNDRQPEIK